MDFLSQYVIPPSGHYMQLLEFLAVMVYLIHLPYIGVVIGSIALSMWLSFRHREVPDMRFDRFAGDLIDVFLGNRWAMLILGVLPLFVLPFIYSQWFAGYSQRFVGPEATPLKYIPMVIPAVAVGFFFVARYAASFRERNARFGLHMMLGMTAVGILKLSYFVLLSSVARLHDPEKWFRIKNIVIMLLNWNVIWKFVFFLHVAGALTGAAVLFFFFGWRSTEMARDKDYSDFVRKFAAGLAMAFTFALPVYYLFYIFTTPDVAFDNTVYVMSAAVSVVALIIALCLLGVLGSNRARFGGFIFSMFLVLFVLVGAVDLRSMNNANYEHYRLVEITAEEVKATRDAELQALMASAGGANLGEEVFNTTCLQCHRMDEKLVGPPLNDVLKKYDGASLAAYLSNPSKIDPNYPPMPNPGLTPAQMRAVSSYLLGEEGTTESSSGGH